MDYRKLGLLIFSMFWVAVVAAKNPNYHYVVIKTEQGDCLLKLYNETPKHRDNFVRLVREGYYEALMFHRVIHNFMLQGGDPDSRYAAQKQALGKGGPGYTIEPEIQESLVHKKGAVGAARDNNPAKRSSGSQFYIVQGRVFTPAALDSLEHFQRNGKKLTAQQRAVYSTVGGTPHLDGEYTVFGELLAGVELIDKVASLETDERDRPLEDVRMSMEVLTRREALNLEREMDGLPPKTGFLTKLLDVFHAKHY